MEGCLRPLILTDWACARVIDNGDEATDALGTFYFSWHSSPMLFPQLREFSILRVLILTDNTEQTDAGLEVHQRLAPYLTSATLTSRMKLSVSAVNFLYIVRDYSPLTTFLAMFLLPLVLIPTENSDDIANSIATKQGTLLFWTKTLFLTTHLASALRNYFTYRHLDLSLVENLWAQEWWSAPCKYLNDFDFANKNHLRIRE